MVQRGHGTGTETQPSHYDVDTRNRWPVVERTGPRTRGGYGDGTPAQGALDPTHQEPVWQVDPTVPGTAANGDRVSELFAREHSQAAPSAGRGRFLDKRGAERLAGDLSLTVATFLACDSYPRAQPKVTGFSIRRSRQAGLSRAREQAVWGLFSAFC